MSERNPDSLREGITVKTADDASYLRPVENFIEIGEWKSNAAGKSAYTTRSPGYGLIYFLFRSFMGEKGSLLGLVILQVFLFSFSVSLLPSLCNNLDIGSKLSLTVGVLAAMLPMFSGFLTYTLTESVTPSLIIICLSLAFIRNYSIKRMIFLSMLTGFLILVRPSMIIWAILPAFFAYRMRDRAIFLIAGALLLTFIPIVIWQINLYHKTGDYQSLHPIYQDDANTIYRPTHKAVWDFHKSWGQTGFEFHKSIAQFSELARQGVSRQEAVQGVMASIPSRVFEHVNSEDLHSYYILYFDIIESQTPYFGTQTPISGLSKEEKKLIAHFENATKHYITGDFYFSNIVVPVRVYRQLAFHSNLSLYIFQESWRGNFLMEFLRLICFSIHSGTFILFLVGIFILGINEKYFIILFPITFYLTYLCIVQRGVEERYTLPILIPMLVVAFKTGRLIIAKIKHLITQ